MKSDQFFSKKLNQSMEYILEDFQKLIITMKALSSREDIQSFDK
jgi:hypothetical protein